MIAPNQSCRSPRRPFAIQFHQSRDNFLFRRLRREPVRLQHGFIVRLVRLPEFRRHNGFVVEIGETGIGILSARGAFPD